MLPTTVRWELVEPYTLDLRGHLRVDADHPPVLRWDADADIPRIIHGVHLPDVTDADLDAWVRPVWVTGDTETPLGIFIWRTSSVRRRVDRPSPLEGGVLYDQTLLLHQRLRSTFGVEDTVADGLARLAADAGIPPSRVRLPADDLDVARPLAWPAGVRRTRVAQDLAGKAGWVTGFDRAGVWHVRRPPDPEMDPPVHVYGEGQTSSILRDSELETAVRGRVPNVWVVISTSPTVEPVVAVRRLPAGDPASVERTGIEVVEHVTEPGLTQEAADRLADDARRASRSRTRTAAVATLPNPAHDQYDVVELLGERWVEVAWELALAPHARHRHTLVRNERPTG